MSMVLLQFVNCDPGFFYQVFDPEQPLGLPVASNLYNYHVPSPSLHYNPYLPQVAVTYTLKGCTNNLGIEVPCYLGPTIMPLVGENPEKETVEIEDVVNFEDAIDPEIVQDTPIEKGAVIEARRKRDADPYYLGYGLTSHYGYYPYTYGYGYRFGCRNYLGVLVPCA